MLLEVAELSFHKCDIKESYRQAVTPMSPMVRTNILHPKYMVSNELCETDIEEC